MGHKFTFVITLAVTIVLVTGQTIKPVRRGGSGTQRGGGGTQTGGTGTQTGGTGTQTGGTGTQTGGTGTQSNFLFPGFPGFPPVFPPQFPQFPFIFPPTPAPTTAPTNPPTPAPACDVCQRLELLTMINTRVMSIQTKVDALNGAGPCPPVPPAGLTVRMGADIDGSPGRRVSTATCDDGSIPVGCQCSAGVGTTCNGVIALAALRECRAFKLPSAATAGLVRAIALCAANANNMFSLRLNAGGLQTNPTVTCPATDRIVDCWLDNRNPGTVVTATTIDTTTRTCTVITACSAGTQGCRLTALCERNTLTSPLFSFQG